jgi:hypothetical protein
LRVEYDKYGSGNGWVNFVKQYVDDYVQLIDKYIEWEKIASSKGDLLNKVIGEADLWIGASLVFRFYSGNERKHYLEITAGESILLDKENVLVLRNLLIKFKNNQIHETDTSVYN